MRIIKKATITDVAEKAGVSISTVSKALTGSGNINSDTIKNIIRISEELGYRPNKAAQMLSRKNKTIGIIIPEDPIEVQQPVVEGLIDTLAGYGDFGIGYILKRYRHNNDAVEVKLCLDEIKDKIDGLIIEPSYSPESYTGYLNELKASKPIISLLIGIEGLDGIGSVSINEIVVGKLAAEYLALAAENKSVAVITGDRDVYIHKKNIEGFLATGEKYGLKTVCIEECFDDMRIAYKLTKRILESYSGISGIFVTSYVAPAVCRRLKESGLQGQVSVIGMDIFGGTVECMLDGSLNALVFQNQYLQAKTAVDRMVDALGGGNPAAVEKIKPELVLKSNLECYVTPSV